MLDHGLHPPRSREKKRNPWRQHVHRATRPRSYAINKVWEAVTSRCLGNGRSDVRCKQYGGVKSIICYLCFMQHAWSCFLNNEIFTSNIFKNNIRWYVTSLTAQWQQKFNICNVQRPHWINILFKICRFHFPLKCMACIDRILKYLLFLVLIWSKFIKTNLLYEKSIQILLTFCHMLFFHCSVTSVSPLPLSFSNIQITLHIIS